MTKLRQLKLFKRLRIPTAPFTSISYGQFRRGNFKPKRLNFPLAVRSTFDGEDGDKSSMAGYFVTRLDVGPEELEAAIEAVFASYPRVDQQEVILQEFIEPDFSGVIFAFRHAVWKLEIIAGRGEQLVGGSINPDTLLLPKFTYWDKLMSKVYRFWKLPPKLKDYYRPLVALSYYTGLLMKKSDHQQIGLDIEFAIKGKRLYLLQARPLTASSEREELLTAANHKEILPPFPSILMTEIISNAGFQLFEYYQSLDRTLAARPFLMKSAGMPWINLSALLDVMVHWGLPTQLVIKSVGSLDSYNVRLRPHRMLQKLWVVFGIIQDQTGTKRKVEQWLKALPDREAKRQAKRVKYSETARADAFGSWYEDFQNVYIELVQHMQVLTATMSGALGLLHKLGILPEMAAAASRKSESTAYFQAFKKLVSGKINKAEFIQRYGHRGFYESDIGQKRFAEFNDEEWKKLLEQNRQDWPMEKNKEKPLRKQAYRLLNGLAEPYIAAVALREKVRNELMKIFFSYRKELLFLFEGYTDTPWDYSRKELMALLCGKIPLAELQNRPRPHQSGWDYTTFLASQAGRRLDVARLAGTRTMNEEQVGLGIYPGKVKGQVWRISQADLSSLTAPAFSSIILVADALDPGFIPFFTKVDGVVAYVGGLLSHASIILRESKIPSITQVPAHLKLRTGDWIEIDGKTGEIIILE